MTKAKHVLTVSVSFTDAPLDLTQIDGIGDAIEQVAETKEPVFVERADDIAHYYVRWNDKTETVRIDALPVGAVYEPPERLYDDEDHPENLVVGDPA